jgi:hypothetical protein
MSLADSEDPPSHRRAAEAWVERTMRTTWRDIDDGARLLVEEAPTLARYLEERLHEHIGKDR